METRQLIFQTLKIGSSGADVTKLQQRLQELGFFNGTVDGKFGETTQQAVMKFQISEKLTADGIVGAKTIGKLFPVPALKLKTPSGLIFDIVDGASSDDARLRQFNPMQAVRGGRNLPRFYFAVPNREALNQQVSEHFKLIEFVSGDEMGRGMVFPYYIPIAIIRLVKAVEDLRDRLGGEPLKLSSAYRSPFYSSYQRDPGFSSAHRFGTAVDIVRIGSLSASVAMMEKVNSQAFDGGSQPGSRPSGQSSIGFEYTESLAEMNNVPDHSHLDMGYISGFPNELEHLGDLLVK